MQYTQAQIDRANAVRLEDFLRTQGERLSKADGNTVGKNMIQPDRPGKQMVSPQPEQGRLSH